MGKMMKMATENYGGHSRSSPMSGFFLLMPHGLHFLAAPMVS